MCSAKIENTRLRRAMRRPVAAQNPASSGSQSVIQRPRLRVGAGVAAVSVVVIAVPSPAVVARSCHRGDQAGEITLTRW
jgi:hypothetical protein